MQQLMTSFEQKNHDADKSCVLPYQDMKNTDLSQRSKKPQLQTRVFPRIFKFKFDRLSKKLASFNPNHTIPELL